jgi:hypothetical protein
LKKPEKQASEWVKENKGPTPEQKDLLARITRLEDDNSRLSKQLGLVQNYHAAAGDPPVWLRPAQKYAQASSTAVLQRTDLHLDEVVDPAQVGGLNAYNREIAELRLRRWANKACEMGDRYRHEWDGALILWNGDMVSGSIHEELDRTNADDLPGTMCFWAPLLAAAIKQVSDFYGGAHVPCVVGNHGRLTQKKQAKGRGRNSWDWLLSTLVRSHLAADPKITWDIAEGSYLLPTVYNDRIFQSHGDEANGGSGWSGVWTPLMTVHRKGCELAAAHGVRVYYSSIGHYHRGIIAPAQGIVCNPTMKGTDEWSLFMRFKPEPPAQNWLVHTPEHGVTLGGPLFVADRAREGW